MSKTLFKKINIFLKVNEQSINSYFNAHDPAPIYKRQLSQEFEEYLMNYYFSVKRFSTVTYKLNIEKEEDRQYADPLIHAIRRHFSLKKTIKEAEFKKFKKRSYMLLFMSLIVIIICLGIIPIFIPGEHGFLGALKEALHVLSWVMLWKPIERLIFYWTPYLKDISIFDKLTNAEVILLGNVQLISVENAA